MNLSGNTFAFGAQLRDLGLLFFQVLALKLLWQVLILNFFQVDDAFFDGRNAISV